MNILLKLKKDMQKSSNPVNAKILQGFYKTGKGEYGEGDVFLGITVPETRKIAIKNKNLPLNNIKVLLKSKIHEERLCALLILVNNFQKQTEKRRDIFNFYIKNTNYINNWDFVDLSSHQIVGNYLLDKDKSILYVLAKSQNIWEKRIAIISTYAFIKNNSYDSTLKIAELLITDKHDLIHKAVGWMLREIGKRDLMAEEYFLKKHYKNMPRTMLRYAIEKFPYKKRKAYLRGLI